MIGMEQFVVVEGWVGWSGKSSHMTGSYYWEACIVLSKSNVVNLIVHVAMVEDSLSFDFVHMRQRQSAEAAVSQEVFFDGFGPQGKDGRDTRVGSEERVQEELVLVVG